MAGAHTSGVSLAPSGTEVKRPAKWVAVLTLLTQAMMIVLVIGLVFRHPGLTKTLLSAIYCLLSILLGYHQVRRAFLRHRMPTRLERGDPGFRFCKFLISLDLACFLIAVMVYFYSFFSAVQHNALFWGHDLSYFVPIILLNNPLLDYLRDRLPPPRPRPKGPGPKIWDSMEPIHSDHWGGRGAV